MNQRAPADIGMHVDEVETPSLIVDLDAFERNLKRMQHAAQRFGVGLRPHAKTHKCPAIALQQIALGAVGVCCQKVSEAEVMVHAGVPDVLVSNEIVSPAKLRRLAVLARMARVRVCVDNAEVAMLTSRVAGEFGVQLDVLVEMNVGANRCGVLPGQATVDLAQRVHGLPGLRFAGLQAYHGGAQHLRGSDERRTAIASAVDKVAQTRDLLAAAGLQCELITGAGTGTYELEAASAVYNELQAGSYVFMDADYARNKAADGGFVREFEHSLFLLATVMSRPNGEIAVVDAGLKSMSFDSGLPVLASPAGAEYIGASDEHGKLRTVEAHSFAIGTRVRLIPGHCDPTVNLHDWLVGVRADRVEAMWSVAARGPGH